MKKVSVTYLGTELVRTKDDIQLDMETEADHFVDIAPVLLEVDAIKRTSLFKIEIWSRFEASSLPPQNFFTLSKFELNNFSVNEDNYEVLEDYSYFAYRKHLVILKNKLTNKNYINKIKNELEPFRKGRELNILEIALNNAS
jgi:hypothetical protein